MKKVKVSELSGKELDYAVYCALRNAPNLGDYKNHKYSMNHYHKDWQFAGEIIEREEISIEAIYKDGNLISWMGSIYLTYKEYGENPLQAAMRVYVLSKLGEVVEIPE